MARDFEIIVIGTYFFDEIYVGLPQFPELGREVFCEDLIITPGATYITVAALARLGVNAGWITCFGNDPYSQHISGLAEAAGMNLSLVRRLERPHRRVTTSLPFAGERAFVTVADPEPDDMLAYMIDTLERSNFHHLHLAWLPGTNYLPLLEVARRKGATISADCQDVPILHDPVTARQMIGHLDVFLPNALELRILTGSTTTAAAVAQAAPWGAHLVVKDGSNGAWVAEENYIEHVPALPVDRVIDTTGAGDCFNAGFLFGWVVEGQSLVRSAHYGAVCAGYSVQGVGGTSNLLDRAMLLQHDIC